MSEYAPYIIPGVVAIIVAWLGLKPKKTDPDQLLRDDLKYMGERVEQQRKISESLEAQVDELRRDRDAQKHEIFSLKNKVDDLWSRMRKVVDYARVLENRITGLTGVPHERPSELDEIFERH
ncbi:hypothetical protein [Rothia koreensis]|uniref:hypothetical protein n=1 Tax=Rothia koreensis TaxID=592378 RepID=UPI003FCE678A